MPFVKLDTGILNSTLWMDRECREIFITGLLMAHPFETTDPLPQIATRSLDYTGFVVPAGWYGFVPAAGVGIVRTAMVDLEPGMAALERLASPDLESRSPEFEGRRLVRVNGGYLVLNYFKYREKDYTTAERSRRYRERKAKGEFTAPRRDKTPSRRDITQAEAEAEADPISTANAVEGGNLRLPPCPYDDIVDLYHNVLPTLPRVVRLTPARKQQIKARWNEDNQNINGWRKFFKHVSESDFLMGRAKPRQDSSTPFMADLEWLTKAANWIKVIEGKYHHG